MIGYRRGAPDPDQPCPRLAQRAAGDRGRGRPVVGLAGVAPRSTARRTWSARAACATASGRATKASLVARALQDGLIALDEL
jgi:hypothetical protein